MSSSEAMETFTQAQVNSIVSSEVTKHRLEDLEAKISSLELSMSQLFAKLEASLQAVSVQIEKSAYLVKECREDLKDEIEREFATKLEVQILEGKVDRMWAKITVAVTVAIVIVNVIFSLIGIM